MAKNDPFWWDGGPLPIKVAYAPNKKAWKIALKQIGLKPDVEPYPENAGRLTTFMGTKFPELVAIVTLNNTRQFDVDSIAGLIAHEATHVAQELARFVYPYNDKARLDAETEAYCVQWVTMNVLAAYRKVHND